MHPVKVQERSYLKYKCVIYNNRPTSLPELAHGRLVGLLLLFTVNWVGEARSHTYTLM